MSKTVGKKGFFLDFFGYRDLYIKKHAFVFGI